MNDATDSADLAKPLEWSFGEGASQETPAASGLAKRLLGWGGFLARVAVMQISYVVRFSATGVR